MSTQSKVMKMAWNIAKKASVRFNDKASKFFAESLKEAWKIVKMMSNPALIKTEEKVEQAPQTNVVEFKRKPTTGRDIFDPTKTYRDPWAAKAARRSFEAKQKERQNKKKYVWANARHMDPLWKTHSVN